MESSLRGTIYDPYIRRVVWEGILGKYEKELPSWIACPPTNRLRVLPLPRWQQILLWFLGSQSKDGGLGSDDERVCPYHWAQPVHALNCEIVWPAKLDQLAPNRVSYAHAERENHACCEDSVLKFEDTEALRRQEPHFLELNTPEYSGRIRDEWVIEKLMAQGGIRLAAVLNWLFYDGLDGGSELIRKL